MEMLFLINHIAAARDGFYDGVFGVAGGAEFSAEGEDVCFDGV